MFHLTQKEKDGLKIQLKDSLKKFENQYKLYELRLNELQLAKSVHFSLDKYLGVVETLKNQLTTLLQIILDQSTKGRGYPVCIAEAHEQAVVKGPDREFFYHCIQKMGIEQKRHLAFSQKTLKKRGIGI